MMYSQLTGVEKHLLIIMRRIEINPHDTETGEKIISTPEYLINGLNSVIGENPNEITDWPKVFEDSIMKGLIHKKGSAYTLTKRGRELAIIATQNYEDLRAGLKNLLKKNKYRLESPRD